VKQKIAYLTALALATMPMAARACDQCMGGKDPTSGPRSMGDLFHARDGGFNGYRIGFFMRYLAKRRARRWLRTMNSCK